MMSAIREPSPPGHPGRMLIPSLVTTIKPQLLPSVSSESSRCEKLQDAGPRELRCVQKE